MLEIGKIRAEKEAFIKAFEKRNIKDIGAQFDSIIEIDDERKRLQTELDQQLSQINTLSKEIGQLFKSGQADKASAAKEQVASLKENSKTLEVGMKKAQEDILNRLLAIPNKPNELVPAGQSEDDNEVYKDWPEPLPELGDGALAHWELGEKYNLFNLKLGVKIAGAGFPLYRGKGAKLERALINFFLDEAHEAGYEEIVAPLLVNEDTARGTGQLPDKDGQMYYVERDDLYLIPTAEVPLTNIYRDVILQEDEFPIKLTGYTPCFRREAGSYGADVKGLNRVHQFDKIEIVQIVHPEKSYAIQEEMLVHIEGLLKKLELPYRILRLCGGDLTSASALTYDFEVYSAAQKRWLEVSSVSNFETYQSNRLKLRYKTEKGKKLLAHTLNGSALALARIFAALLENNYTSEGIGIPEALRKYTGFDIIN
jgi:seryl-tRNA synthetase